jgi:hypothetical protein
MDRIVPEVLGRSGSSEVGQALFLSQTATSSVEFIRRTSTSIPWVPVNVAEHIPQAFQCNLLSGSKAMSTSDQQQRSERQVCAVRSYLALMVWNLLLYL